VIRNVEDLAALLGVEANIEAISQRIYETSECGAWVAEALPAIESSTKKAEPATGGSLFATATVIGTIDVATALIAGRPSSAIFPIPLAKETAPGGEGRGRVAINEQSFKPGIVIGSFVEGADDEIESIHLAFPFTRVQFYNAVAAIETRVNDIMVRHARIGM
jgi:hypothetical protein